MNRHISRNRCCLLVAHLCLIAAHTPAARAGLLPAGQTITFASADYVDPLGLPIAEGEVPFTLHYHPDAAFKSFDGSLDGTLSQAVIRDVQDNTLTFLYSVTVNAPGEMNGLAESTQLRVQGFGNAPIDLTGWLRAQSAALLSRSADGASVEIASTGAGAGGVPLLAVKTSATNYDAGGTGSLFAADHFAHDDTGEVWPATATASFTGVFRPADDAAPAVPLPRAAFSGAGVMMACVLIMAAQRRRQTRRA